MAPNPNECAALMQSLEVTGDVMDEATRLIKSTAPLQVQVQVKILAGDDSSEDGEHFYDAASEIHSDGDAGAKKAATDGEDADSDDSFVPPDAELAAQIVEQVEFYFSDAHILKDAFLLKHARRNRDGYISLKLITSFKKVKHVSKDWRVVAHACRQSKALQVNELGTKVRRVAPLPDVDETTPSRTVVAVGLAPERATIEAVCEMFAAVGAIALVRVLRPGAGSVLPPDVRQCANRNPDVLASLCAVVEFETGEAARQAMRLNLAPVRLIELTSRRGSNKNSPTSSRPVTPSLPSAPPSPSNRRPVVLKPSDDSKSPFNRRREVNGRLASQASTPCQSPMQRRHVVLSGNHSNNSSCNNSSVGVVSARSEPSSPQSHSPWVQRRMAAPVASVTTPTGAVRMPHGPDGTRGFHAAQQKPRSASAPESPCLDLVLAF